jgi:hypothetical protein
MATTDQPTIYDELLDLFADTANADRLQNFRLSSEKQSRLDMLLQKNRDGELSAADRAELDEFERLEHLGRMLKARLRRKNGS